MAKKAEQNKVCDKTGLTLEQNTVYDDNLLPSADELAKLDNVSKDIIPWIMKLQRWNKMHVLNLMKIG